MVAISKPVLLDYTCYEIGHTWTPSCKQASIDIAIIVAKQAIKIYGPLYLIAGLIRKRGKSYYKKKVWREILQSTLFLTTNGTLFITFFCLWRKVTGFYFYLSGMAYGIPASAVSLPIERKERHLGGMNDIFYYVNTIAFIPCLAASFVAVLQERKSRRGLLAVYMANIASETLWRMLEARGWVKSLPHGEVLLFSLASAVYLFYFKKKDGLPEGTLSMFRKILGSCELPAPDVAEDGPLVESNGLVCEPSSRHKPPYLQALAWIKQCPSHGLCRHKHSCLHYVLEGSLKLFGVGYAVQGGINLVKALGRVFKQPKSVIYALVNKSNFQLGAFLGSFVGIYRALNCLLRWLRDKDESLHGMVAGFMAGWSMLFYKSQTVALYTAWKLAEMMYFKGISRGLLPYIQCADVIIYSISTALVFHCAVLEPHNIRPAYWKFLLRVTGNKFAYMNRQVLDPYVPNCSKIMPGFWPDYDMRYTNLKKPGTS